MNPIYLGAFIGFVMGASGYIIVRFWIGPISKYNKIKKEITARLHILQDSIKKQEAVNNKDSAKKLQKLAAALSDSFDLGIPHWYKMVLDNRKEFPKDAAADLMKLANTRQKDHMEKRISSIKKNLHI